VIYFLKDGAIELVDMKSKKVFLKRTKVDGVAINQLYVGASVNILARQMKIVEYGDEFTRRSLGTRREQTVAVLSQAELPSMGAILDQFSSKALVIMNLRLGFIAQGDAEELAGKDGSVAAQLAAGPVLAIELLGANAISLAREVLESSKRSGSARHRAAAGPGWLCSTDDVDAARHVALVFGDNSVVQPSPAFSNSTLCLIKPHAVSDGIAGQILDAIVKAGYTVSAVQTFTLDNASASEFLEVYKGVVSEYPAMVAALTAGTSIAVELVGGEDVQQRFREFCGPTDPEIARHIRKSTLRAQFGTDKVLNAVHCTDLADDAALEVDYFFKILA